MSSKRLAALLLTAVMVTATAAPAVAAASEESLDVTADQSPETGDATVSVTMNGSAVANATVNVSSSGTYAGNGTYETDANGTVDLPNPEEAVEATLDVTADGQNATETVELVPYDDSLSVAVDQRSTAVVVTVSQYGTAVENATVDVNASGYAGAGTYRTDANGTVSLPAPEETVNATVVASDDNETVEATVELVATNETAEPAPFGLRVSSFVQDLLGGDREGGIGQTVSEFVRQNNPGNANGPDRADDAGNASTDDRRGPPEQAKNGNASDEAGNGERPDEAGNDERPDNARNDERPENGSTANDIDRNERADDSDDGTAERGNADEHTSQSDDDDDAEADDDRGNGNGTERGGGPDGANGNKR